MTVRGALVERHLTLRTVNKDERTVDFVASTEAIDSYGEIVEQKWRLDRFKSNPVLLFAHDSRSLPIGQVTKCDVMTGPGGPQLECSVKLASAAANPLAENVWQSIVEGTLRAVSVGFVPNDVRYEKRGGEEVFVLSDNELHELSVVAIPANPQALAKMRTDARAAAAEHRTAHTSTTGDDMAATLEEMTKRNADLEVEKRVTADKLTETTKALETANREKATLETQNAALVTERDTFKANAEKAAAIVIERDVEAIVGVKILPAEKEAFVELAKSNPDLFKKMVAQRSDLKLLKPAMGEETGKPGETTKSAEGSGEDFAAAVDATPALSLG